MTNLPNKPYDGIGISLVGDDPTIRRARQILLLSERYDVRSYATGAALLADPRSRDFPCIVVDLAGHDSSSSGGGGLDLIRAMRASGWRGRAILIDDTTRSPAIVDAAERHGDSILDRTTGDASLLTAIAASIFRGWSG